jgi:hypothetical protein
LVASLFRKNKEKVFVDILAISDTPEMDHPLNKYPSLAFLVMSNG